MVVRRSRTQIDALHKRTMSNTDDIDIDEDFEPPVSTVNLDILHTFYFPQISLKKTAPYFTKMFIFNNGKDEVTKNWLK